jgi:hypothetical protein
VEDAPQVLNRRSHAAKKPHPDSSDHYDEESDEESDEENHEEGSQGSGSVMEDSVSTVDADEEKESAIRNRFFFSMIMHNVMNQLSIWCYMTLGYCFRFSISCIKMCTKKIKADEHHNGRVMKMVKGGDGGQGAASTTSSSHFGGGFVTATPGSTPGMSGMATAAVRILLAI